MGRHALDLGEAGNIQVVGQVQEGTKWVPAGRRKAQRYRARAYYRGHDGIRRDVAVTADSRARATNALEVRLAEILAHSNDVEMTKHSPLISAGRIWLQEIARTDSGLSARTIQDYTRAFNRHIDTDGASLRGLTLAQANNPQRLRGFLQRVADSRGSGSAKICRSVLTGIFDLAVDSGVLHASAMQQVRSVRSQTPKESPRDHSRAFTREERDSIIAFADLQAAGDLNPRTRRKREATADLIAFMAGTGARIEEARAQRWNAINLDTGACEIRGTKTASSDRVVTLPDWLADRLRRRAKEGDDGLVFSSPATANDPWRPWDQSNSARAVRRVLDGAGFDWAIPHTLRRTVATLLDEAGVPIRRIADQLGHADPSMTARVYLGRDFGGDKADLGVLL